MFLKSLTIENPNKEETVQNIKFRKGINLIVDTTNPEDIKESGNNVGKTTVLRLIDFCLGGDGKNIYRDREFKERETNTVVKNFLENSNIIITLVLKENLDNENSSEIKIRRNFLSLKGKSGILEIEGKHYSSIVGFKAELGRLIFETELEKPTFREIISKNIRYEEERLQKTIKFLRLAKTAGYEAIFLFWLGIETESAGKKQWLIRQLRAQKNLLAQQEKERGNLSKVTQELLHLEREIEELERKKEWFAIDVSHKKHIQRFNIVRKDINRLSTENSRLETRKDLIKESLTELERAVSDIDTERIKALYDEAKVLIPGLQKTFEETLSFHNQMLNEKKMYIKKELPGIEQQLRGNELRLSELISEELNLSQKLQKTNVMESLEMVIKELSDSHNQKGHLEERKELLKEVSDRISDYEGELQKINEGINLLEDQIDERIDKFNIYLSAISSELYGESFILSHGKNQGDYELDISTYGGNPGMGKKKGEILAFDLAYIQFADAMNIKCLHFVLHDQIEIVHGHQISTLLTKIVERVNGQLVLPVLNDKLPSDIDAEQYTILELSQSHKLFGV